MYFFDIPGGKELVEKRIEIEKELAEIDTFINRGEHFVIGAHTSTRLVSFLGNIDASEELDAGLLEFFEGFKKKQEIRVEEINKKIREMILDWSSEKMTEETEIEIQNRKTNKRLLRASVSKKVPFGEGVLMPVFVKDKDEVGIILAKHPNQYKVGEEISFETAKKDVEDAKLLTCLSFPRNSEGKKALGVFRGWLDMLEEEMEE